MGTGIRQPISLTCGDGLSCQSLGAFVGRAILFRFRKTRFAIETSHLNRKRLGFSTGVE